MHTQNKDILFLPQDAFFLKIADLPEGVDKAGLRVYAETVLESFSPLALDLLRWGYCEGSSQILIFAAAADRLAKFPKFSAEMEKAEFATCLAAFVFGMDLGVGWSLIRRESGDYCEWLAVLSEGEKWKEVYALRLESGCGSDEVQRKFAKMGAGAAGKFDRGFDFSLEKTSILKPLTAVVEGGGIVASKKADGAKFRAAADVRDSVMLKAAKKAIFFGKALIWLSGLAAAFCAFLFFWEISLLFRGSSLKNLEAKYAGLSPRAEYVKNMMDEAAFLNSLNSKKIDHVSMLAAINKYRPESVSFNKSSSKAPGAIEIKGKAQSVAAATQFERALKSGGEFKNVKLAISGSGSGGTSWTLNADFK